MYTSWIKLCTYDTITVMRELLIHVFLCRWVELQINILPTIYIDLAKELFPTQW